MKDSKLIIGLILVILIAGLILGYKIFAQEDLKVKFKKEETELLNDITNEVEDKTKNEQKKQTTMQEEEKQKLQQQLEQLDKYEKNR